MPSKTTPPEWRRALLRALGRYDRKRPPVDVEAVKAEIIRKCERMARAAQT